MDAAAARGSSPVVACLMLKAPRPGLVKTRLARLTGNGEAARIYRRLVEFQMGRLPADWRIEIHFAPADAETEMRSWLGAGALYEPQMAGDLGDRMRGAMFSAFGRGAAAAIFLGGDCPYVDGEILSDASGALATADLVLGPALDGGYYLLGTRRPLPSLFDSIDWGTGAVLHQTLDRAARARLRVALLAKLEDVDDLPSWRRASRLAGIDGLQPSAP